MSYFSYTNTITNGISADGANLMTNFNDVRAALIDGTKDINVAAIACTTLTPSGNVTVSNQTASTVATFNASKVLTSSSVTTSQLKPITNWGDTAWTPTGLWVANATYTGKYRRVGDVGQFRVTITTSGTVTGGSLTINLPASHTIDTTKLTGSSNGIILGNCTIIDSATTYYSGIVTYSSTTAVEIDVFAISTFAGTVYTRFTTVTKDIPFSFGNTDVVSIYFEVPIVEYA